MTFYEVIKKDGMSVYIDMEELCYVNTLPIKEGEDATARIGLKSGTTFEVIAATLSPALEDIKAEVKHLTRGEVPTEE